MTCGLKYMLTPERQAVKLTFFVPCLCFLKKVMPTEKVLFLFHRKVISNKKNINDKNLLIS